MLAMGECSETLRKYKLIVLTPLTWTSWLAAQSIYARLVLVAKTLERMKMHDTSHVYKLRRSHSQEIHIKMELLVTKR